MVTSLVNNFPSGPARGNRPFKQNTRQGTCVRIPGIFLCPTIFYAPVHIIPRGRPEISTETILIGAAAAAAAVASGQMAATEEWFARWVGGGRGQASAVWFVKPWRNVRGAACKSCEASAGSSDVEVLSARLLCFIFALLLFSNGTECVRVRSFVRANAICLPLIDHLRLHSRLGDKTTEVSSSLSPKRN